MFWLNLHLSSEFHLHQQLGKRLNAKADKNTHQQSCGGISGVQQQ